MTPYKNVVLYWEWFGPKKACKMNTFKDARGFIEHWRKTRREFSTCSFSGFLFISVSFDLLPCEEDPACSQNIA